MSQLTDRLERDLQEIAAGAQPSPSAWESISARLGDDEAPDVELVLAPSTVRSKRRTWITAVAAAAAVFLVVAASIAVLTSIGDDHSSPTADPAAATAGAAAALSFSRLNARRRAFCISTAVPYLSSWRMDTAFKITSDIAFDTSGLSSFRGRIGSGFPPSSASARVRASGGIVFDSI